jgi:hypothetical protein
MRFEYPLSKDRKTQFLPGDHVTLRRYQYGPIDTQELEISVKSDSGKSSWNSAYLTQSKFSYDSENNQGGEPWFPVQHLFFGGDREWTDNFAKFTVQNDGRIAWEKMGE